MQSGRALLEVRTDCRPPRGSWDPSTPVIAVWNALMCGELDDTARGIFTVASHSKHGIEYMYVAGTGFVRNPPSRSHPAR